MNNLKILILCTTAITGSITWASDLTIPNTFVAHTPAVAADVNGNFTAVEASVDDNNSRLTTLEALVTGLQDQLNAVNLINDDLETRLATVEANSVLELDGHLSYKVVNSYATADFQGVNVRIGNGTNTTDGSINGLGNLTIGYNEPSGSTTMFCSEPGFTDEASCFAAGGIWARNVRRGSHNLIVGLRNSYDNFASILVGTDNIANANYANLIGGHDNMVNGTYSSIIGGRNHFISGNLSVISGGDENEVTGAYSSISGGSGNIAYGDGTSITGGIYNETYDFFSSITGGRLNTADGRYAVVNGGESNTASGEASTVSGGEGRTVTGIDDWQGGSLFEDF